MMADHHPFGSVGMIAMVRHWIEPATILELALISVFVGCLGLIAIGIGG